MQIRKTCIATSSLFMGRLLVFFLFLSGCAVKPKQLTEVDLELRVLYPVLIQGPTGYEPIKDTVLIQFRRDTVLYHIPFIEFDLVGLEAKNQRRKYCYFLYRLGKDSGIYMKYLDTVTVFSKVNVDTILANHAFKKDIDVSGFQFISRKGWGNKGMFTDQYTYPAKQEDDLDSLYLNYNKDFMNLPFSLSPKLDSIQKSRLYKVHAIFNEQQNSIENKPYPRREYILEFEVKKNMNHLLLDSAIAILQLRNMNF